MSDKSTMLHATYAGDVASVLALIGSLAGYLPPIATLCAIVWYGLMIYDWLQKHRRVPAVLPVDKETKE